MKPNRAGIAVVAWIASLGLLSGCAPKQEATAPTVTTPPSPSSSTPATAGSASTQQVTLKTSDGWSIVGDLYAPSGGSKGAVVLLHQRGGSAQDWQPLSRALQQAGITALAIDQRGAGRSTQGPGPTGNDAPWPTGEDIAAAVASLKDKGPVGLAGASYGANNALIYAAAHPDQIKSLALFSPGVDYHGLDALTPAHTYNGSVNIYHNKGDTVANDGPDKINAAFPSSDHHLNVYDGDGHGTELLNTNTVTDAVNFFQRTLK